MSCPGANRRTLEYHRSGLMDWTSMAQFRYLPLTALVAIALLLLVSDVARADSITNDSGTLRIEDDGAHMRVASSSSLHLTGSMAIEMWARFEPLDATPGAEIVKRGDSTQG